MEHRDFARATFPFLLEVDRALDLVQCGSLWPRVMPEVRAGASLWSLFRLRSTQSNPKDFEALRALQRRSVILDAVADARQLVMRGEWLQAEGEDRLLFLGWPWVLDSEDLAGIGLSLADFPAHTPLGDMLVLLRSNQNTLADTRELAERLQKRSGELRQTNRQLQQLAHYDALTELPNRVLLADRLRQAMRQCERRASNLAVVYLDLDGFKPINDHHGHGVGDQMLKVLAQRLKDQLREGDTLARIGGDEFVAVLGDLESPADCEPVLDRLLQVAAGVAMVAGLALKVSASIGVTFYPQDASDADLLLRHADQAMYQAKQSGKNRWHVFDLARDAAVTTRRESLERMREGLRQGEFVLYYQPQVDLARQRVLAVEALIRWEHPTRGLLLPAEFLSLTDEDPLGFSLGEWVLQTALHQLAAWNLQGLNLGVSVNLDPVYLQSPHFVKGLRALLAQQPDVRPGQLTLEVLESCAMADMELAESVLRECHALGVRCALDDFGTGYSSLVYLKRLSADTLKIDRSFVMGMLEGADDKAIVQGIVSLAAAFGRDVMAEGVETAAHAQALRALGCHRAQGFGIARPMPAPQVSDWMSRFKPAQGWPYG